MIWYRGVNFFPSAVEDIVRGFSELSPEYQIRIGEERSLPTITIVVKSDHDVGQLEQRVASRIKDGIGISPRVKSLRSAHFPGVWMAANFAESSTQGNQEWLEEQYESRTICHRYPCTRAEICRWRQGSRSYGWDKNSG